MSYSLSISSSDIGAQLEALLQQQSIAEQEVDKQTAHVEVNAMKQQREQQREAEDRAEKAAKEHSFWDDVGTIAKDVAAAGAIAGAAFSGGSTLVVAGALIGGGLTLSGQIAEKLGVNKNIWLGLELTGAGVTLLSGGVSAFAGVGQDVSQTSALAALVAKTVAGGASVVEGGADLGGGLAASRETNAKADGLDAGAAADHSKSVLDDALDAMQRKQNDTQRGSEVAASIQNADQQADAVLTNAVRG